MASLLKAAIIILLALLLAWLLARGDDRTVWKLDDFEDGDLNASPGLAWVSLADDLIGMDTESKLELRPGAPESPRHSLALSGRLADRSRSFAGAWVGLERTGRSVDLDAFDGVRLRVKSTCRLQIGLRAGMVNYMANIDATADWRQVEVPFSTLEPLGKVPDGVKWNARGLAWFGVSTPQNPSGEDHAPMDFSFEVDDVVLYGHGGTPPVPSASGPPGAMSTVPFTPIASIPSTGWVVLGDDPARDGNVPSLPDATRLEAIPSAPDGNLWVRVTLRETPHDRWMGMNVALDIDGDPTNGRAWWGANKAFKYDKLVSVWCTRVPGGCQGFIGIADAGQTASGTFAPGGSRPLQFAIDRDRRAFIVGIPRDALGLKSDPLRLVAGVGSALLFADDVPGEGAAILR